MEESLAFLTEAPHSGMLVSIIAHITLFLAQLVNICDTRELWLKKYGKIKKRFTITGATEEYLSLGRTEEANIARSKAIFPMVFVCSSLLLMVAFGIGLRHIILLHMLFVLFRIVYIIRIIFDKGYALFYETEDDVSIIYCTTLNFKDKSSELGDKLIAYKRIGLYYQSDEDLIRWYHNVYK